MAHQQQKSNDDPASTESHEPEKTQKPGDSDSDAARGADKSRNGEEFEREGRNPKPFSVN